MRNFLPESLQGRGQLRLGLLARLCSQVEGSGEVCHMVTFAVGGFSANFPARDRLCQLLVLLRTCCLVLFDHIPAHHGRKQLRLVDLCVRFALDVDVLVLELG